MNHSQLFIWIMKKDVSFLFVVAVVCVSSFAVVSCAKQEAKPGKTIDELTQENARLQSYADSLVAALEVRDAAEELPEVDPEMEVVKRCFEEAQYLEYYNGRYGFYTYYPDCFDEVYESDNSDGCTFERGDICLSMSAMYNVLENSIEELMNDNPSYELAHRKVLAKDYYVLQGMKDDKAFFEKTCLIENDEKLEVVVSYCMSFPKAYAEATSSYLAFAEESLFPIPLRFTRALRKYDPDESAATNQRVIESEMLSMKQPSQQAQQMQPAVSSEQIRQVIDQAAVLFLMGVFTKAVLGAVFDDGSTSDGHGGKVYSCMYCGQQFSSFGEKNCHESYSHY